MAMPLLDDGSMGNYAFILESTERCEILYVLGDVDLYSDGDFEAALTKALRPERPLVVDLSDCDYFGAAALSALVRARSRARGPLSLRVRGRGIAARVLALAEFERLFPIADSL